jgi:hypothetical protein
LFNHVTQTNRAPSDSSFSDSSPLSFLITNSLSPGYATWICRFFHSALLVPLRSSIITLSTRSLQYILFFAEQARAFQLPTMTSLFGAPAQNTGSSLFGNAANKSPFGGTTTGAQSTATGMFGQQNQQQGSLGGSTFGASTTPQTQQSGGLFGNAQKPQNSLLGGSTFGQQQQQPQQQSSVFGTSLGQKPQGSLFGGNTQQATGLGGGSLLGNQQQQAQQPQQSQFGQTTMATPQGQQQQPPLSSSLWSPGRAITGGKHFLLFRMADTNPFI